ncbi:ABC transporter permease [Stratiformator vulcanicus]|uniref:Macrolide export ATP-binding/permease protein MacB n=1 Tax=Stratiformator vulcanicus TaxID=2527980 RepID=A0A517QXT0_9PLAN|nr:ABC transporter permease [Stratiformator vulcanicus]QDT36441.1 Macrolide export ATP-binding/permease protein MacB [Stratiformator vulcanicus]
MLLFALRNLWSRPARTILALLGLTVAIAGMVGLFSVAHGLDATVKDTFARVPGLVAMQPGAPIPLFSTLPSDWQQEIEQVDGVGVVNTEVWQRVNMINGKAIISPPRLFCGTDIPSRLQLSTDLFGDSIIEGRYLTLEDRGTTNCVVSNFIAEEFGATVGDVLTPNGVECKIVGIYSVGSILVDVAIVLDVDMVRQITRYDPETVSAFYIEAAPGAEPKAVAERISDNFADRAIEPWRPSELLLLSDKNPVESLFESIDQLLSGELKPAPAPPSLGAGSPTGSGGEPKSGVDVRTMDDWSAQFDQLTGDLDLFLSILTSIGLTIAVLSVINTMLMSVSERIIEFGILKANGWSRLDVVKLITAESGLIGLGGGVLGTSIGWAATLILNAYFPDRLNLYASPELIGFALIFSSLLGVVGGLYPALWAMRMAPMEAIRRG